MPSIFKPGNKRPRRIGDGALGTSTYQFTIAGITHLGSGAADPFCTVDLFNQDDNTWIARTTSDANGAYTFHPATNSGFFFARATSQDGNRKGTTLNLTAV